MQAFAPDGSVLISESNTALIDQLVSIVQHVLETKVEGALEHLVHVKIDDIVLNLIMYVTTTLVLLLTNACVVTEVASYIPEGCGWSVALGSIPGGCPDFFSSS